MTTNFVEGSDELEETTERRYGGRTETSSGVGIADQLLNPLLSDSLDGERWRGCEVLQMTRHRKGRRHGGVELSLDVEVGDGCPFHECEMGNFVAENDRTPRRLTRFQAGEA